MSGDWLRPDWLRDVVRSWTPAAVVPPHLTQAIRQVVELFGFAPAVVGKEVIDAATSRLIGRSITIRAGGQDVTLVLRLLRLVRPPVGLMVGQLGDVELEAEDVRASDLRIDHLRLELRNLHVQPGLTAATVVASPIKIRAALDRQAVSAAVARRTGRVDIDLRPEGTIRAHLAGRREWGHVEVVPRVDGRTLLLEPTAVAFRRWERLSPAVRRLPPLRIALPDLAAPAHVTDVTVEGGRLVVRGVYEEWREAVTPVQLDRVVRRIQGFEGGVLDLR